MNKKVYISKPFCFCNLRMIDSVRIRNYFTLNNFKVVHKLEEADYHICFTCGVSKSILEKHINYFQEIKDSKSELIVMGCIPGTNPDELKAVFSGKTVVTNDISGIDKYFPEFRIKFLDVPEVYSYEVENIPMYINNTSKYSVFQLLSEFGLTQTLLRKIHYKRQANLFFKKNKGFNVLDPCFIRICWGCTNNCTYCNIRNAIGTIKSKSIESLCNEYSKLLEQGNRNFHFVAEDLCSYGQDIGSSLGDLMKALSVVDENYNVKWTLYGVNPRWLVLNYNEFMHLFKYKIWEIITAIESGSDRLLGLMNRNYKIIEVEKALLDLRKANKGLSIKTLFIVGFPSETEDDFQLTINLVKKVKFDLVAFSQYSELEKLASAGIFPKIDPAKILERIKRANKMAKKLKIEVLFDENT